MVSLMVLPLVALQAATQLTERTLRTGFGALYAALEYVTHAGGISQNRYAEGRVQFLWLPDNLQEGEEIEPSSEMLDGENRIIYSARFVVPAKDDNDARRRLVAEFRRRRPEVPSDYIMPSTFSYV